MTREIPVHVTYFTAVAGEGGQVSYYSDHLRLRQPHAAALGGRPLPPEMARLSRRTTTQPARRAGRSAQKQQSHDFFSGLFGN